MNYIKHLNAVMKQFSNDSRLNTTHISLYMALFYIWNYNRFPDGFFINREEVMKQSKIGSKSTYHRCIRELDHWKYVSYKPSHNPFKGSRVYLYQFGTSETLGVDLEYPKNEQAVVSYININKHNINNNKPLYKKEIFNFFKKNNWSEKEAQKFFSYYESVGWKKGGNPIENWQEAVKSWILKKDDFKFHSAKKSKTDQTYGLPLDHFEDHLHVNQNKRYDEPL